MNTLEIIQEVFGNNEVSEAWLEKQFAFAYKIHEMGVQEGMRREHAMWQLAKVGQEIELGITYEEANPHVQAVNISEERVHKTEKNEHEPVAWVGLTTEEIIDLLPVGEWAIEPTLIFAQRIETKLKEKNHG